MKKLIGLTVVFVMLSININAQQKQQQQRKGNDYTPEQMATLQSKRMTLDLDLNTTQQQEVYNLMKQNAANRQPNKASMKNGNGAELTSEQRYEMQNQRLNNQIQQKDALKKILTDEQFEKWEKIMNNKRNKQGQKGNRQGNPSKK